MRGLFSGLVGVVVLVLGFLSSVVYEFALHDASWFAGGC